MNSGIQTSPDWIYVKTEAISLQKICLKTVRYLQIENDGQFEQFTHLF